MPKASKLYDGPNGPTQLAEDLGRQLILNRGGSAAAVAAIARVLEYESDETLISQDDTKDDCLFFILEGRVRICSHKREIRIRGARCHVGEIGCMDPRAGRTADVIAIEKCVVAAITADQFRTLADDPNYQLWRRLAETLADRLREHTAAVREKNDRPQIFIGSTTESLPIAKALERGINIDPGLNARAWDSPDIFRASEATMESLERTLPHIDFMVLVASGDDWTVSRGHGQVAPRDNIVLEIGLGMGAITRKRTFILAPGSQGRTIKIPSDLLGLTRLHYDNSRLARPGPVRWALGKLPFVTPAASPSTAQLDEAVKDVCVTLRNRMLADGPF